MVHRRWGARLAAGAAPLVAVGLVIAVGTSPAHASGDVLQVAGSAFGYHASGITLFGQLQTETGPTPTVKLASNASNSPQSASAATGVVTYGPATLFTSDAISVQTSGSLGATGSVTSTSSVKNINKATTQTSTGSEPLTADSISGTCSATTTGTTGSVAVTNGTVVTDNGDATHQPVTVSVPAKPAPNTAITGVIRISASDTESFKYVFNEQTTDANGVLTVNSVDDYLQGPTAKGNVVVGQVVCGVSTSSTPLSTPTPTPTGSVSASSSSSSTTSISGGVSALAGGSSVSVPRTGGGGSGFTPSALLAALGGGLVAAAVLVRRRGRKSDE